MVMIKDWEDERGKVCGDGTRLEDDWGCAMCYVCMFEAWLGSLSVAVACGFSSEQLETRMLWH